MNTRLKQLVIGLVLAIFASAGQAQLSSQTQNLLPEEEAFMVIADVTDSGVLTVYWQIADGYYNKLFMGLLNSQDDAQKTAFEVGKIDEEKLAQLGPVLEAVHSEDIGPGVQRTFQVMMDALKNS